VLQLDPRDNILVALRDLRVGEEVAVGGRTHTLVSNVPAKHKFAWQAMKFAPKRSCWRRTTSFPGSAGYRSE
jgi:altronate hydrolase